MKYYIRTYLVPLWVRIFHPETYFVSRIMVSRQTHHVAALDEELQNLLTISWSFFIFSSRTMQSG